MTWFRVGGSGIPAALKNRMNAVLNKKFGTAVDYPPNGWPDDVNLMGPLPEVTVSGNPAIISDGADQVPTKNVVVTLPASLTGYTAAGVENNGKNLYDGTLSSSGASYIECYGNVHNPASVTTGLKVKAGMTYTISFAFPSALTSGIYGAYLSNKTLITLKSNTSTANPTATFTAPQDDELCFWLYFSGGSTAPDPSLVTCQVEIGSTATAYTPYIAPTTYTAELGRTIYGGEVDIVNGEGTDAYKNYVLDNLTWSSGTIGGVSVWYIDLSSDGLLLPANSAIFSGICDDYTPIRFNAVKDNLNSIALRDNGRLYVNNGSDTTEPTGKVTIELATPTDFTFDGQEINTRLGYNAFMSDQGDSEVTYRRDIDLALQAVSNNRGLMMARPAIEPANIDQGSEESTEINIETEGEQDAR